MSDRPTRTATVTVSCYWNMSRKSWAYVARNEKGQVLALEVVDTGVELDRVNVGLLLRAMRRTHEGLLDFS